MNVTQAALGTKKIQKGKIAKSESKTLQKVAKSREYTGRKDLFWLSTALAAPEKAGKVVHVCGCFFGAKVSKATSRWVCSQKRYMCEAVSCLEMNGDVCRFESLLLREKVSLKSFHLPLSFYIQRWIHAMPYIKPNFQTFCFLMIV